MPVIQFAPQASPHQVDDFPKDCERSHAGALHVRPGATKTVTKAELAHLQKRKTPLRVVRADDPAPKAAQKAPQAAAQGSGASAPSAASAVPSAASGGDSGDDSSAAGGKGGKKGSK